MPDNKHTALPFESADPAEQKLWAALGELPMAEPSANLRRSFYGRLDRAIARRWGQRLRQWLGLSTNKGWLTAAACLLVGFAVAQVADQQNEQQNIDEPSRLAALEANMALLNRELILDRLLSDTAGTRLQGVLHASNVVASDNEVAQALLQRAVTDRSPSVRSAAIDALAPQLDSASVGDSLMTLLSNAESPIVQMALVDLVLRHGSLGQLEQLRRLAAANSLHPDLVVHVQKSLGSQSI